MAWVFWANGSVGKKRGRHDNEDWTKYLSLRLSLSICQDGAPKFGRLTLTVTLTLTKAPTPIPTPTPTPEPKPNPDQETHTFRRASKEKPPEAKARS